MRVIGNDFEVDKGGALKAHSEDLCLMIKPSADATEVGFEYEFNASAIGAHVSVVAYRGAGSDTHMNAVLIQRNGETEATLSIWMHDELAGRWKALNFSPACVFAGECG